MRHHLTIFLRAEVVDVPVAENVPDSEQAVTNIKIAHKPQHEKTAPKPDESVVKSVAECSAVSKSPQSDMQKTREITKSL